MRLCLREFEYTIFHSSFQNRVHSLTHTIPYTKMPGNNIVQNNSEHSSSEFSETDNVHTPLGESAPPAHSPGTDLSRTPSRPGASNPSTSGDSALFSGMDHEEKRSALLALLQSCGPGPGPVANHQINPPSEADTKPRATSSKYRRHQPPCEEPSSSDEWSHDSDFEEQPPTRKDFRQKNKKKSKKRTFTVIFNITGKINNFPKLKGFYFCTYV